MKKKSKIIIAVLIFALMVCCGVYVYAKDMPSSWLGTRAYQGDRITINLHIKCDNENAKIKKNDNEKYVLLPSKDGVTLSARANEYGRFHYSLLINNEIPLYITVDHFNWWEITKSDLYIDVEPVTGNYSVYEEYEYTEESPYYHIVRDEKQKKEFSFNIMDGVVDVQVGKVG